MYDCYYGDASTVETSVFINAEILVRLYFRRSLKNVLLYTEAPKHRLVEQEISECPGFLFFFLGGGGHRRDRLSPFSLPFTLLNRGVGVGGAVFLPSPSTFTLKPSAFLLLYIPFSPFLPSPSPFTPLHPSCPLLYTFKATKRRGVWAEGRYKVGVRVGKRGGRR